MFLGLLMGGAILGGAIAGAITNDSEPVNLDSTGYDDDYYNDLKNEDADSEPPYQTSIYGNQSYNNFLVKGQVESTLDPYNLSYGSGTKILGCPLFYSPLADPFNRVYSKIFQSDMPVVYISPGIPKLNKKLVSGSGASAVTILGEAVTSFGVTNISNYNDVRFVGFKPAYNQYYKYAQTMLDYVYNLLNLKGGFHFSDEVTKMEGKYGIGFFGNKATTISESQSNSYSQSQTAQEANSKAAEVREQRQLNAMSSGGNFLKSIASNLVSALSDMVANVPIIGNLVAPLARTLNGSQLYYPNLWSDSSFEKSYEISLKLFTPYGDNESVFRYLYVPFISLLAMALPRADGVYGYKEPFLVRVSCPGWFEVECGCINSITFSRGGNEALWTESGLPCCIDVTLSVTDLYPNLIGTKSMKELKYNAGLASFLECMAGISFNQLAFSTRLNTALSMKVDNFVDLISLKRFRNWVSQDLSQAISGKIINALKF